MKAENAGKKYNTQLAVGYIVFGSASEYFRKCRFSSAMIERMYLNYSEMPEPKRKAARERVRRALSACMAGGMQDLYAEVHIQSSGRELRLVFTTCGYGDLIADVAEDGAIRMERH